MIPWLHRVDLYCNGAALCNGEQGGLATDLFQQEGGLFLGPRRALGNGRFTYWPVEFTEETDKVSLLRSAMENSGVLSESDSIQVNADGIDEDLCLNGEENQLGQVFTNLIQNACQAMPEGGVLTLEAEALADSLVRVSVRDTGQGIKPEDLDKIFEPFYTTKPAGMGTGLGLSVCYGIIKSHKGEIRVESTPEHGTVFFVELPQA